MGLELCNSELNKTFNKCLDNLLPLWEMEGLKILCYCSLVITPGQSVPMAEPLERAKSATTPPENSEASLSLSHRQRSRSRRAAKSTPVVPESTPEEAVPEPLHQISILADPPLISTRAAGISRPSALVVTEPVTFHEFTQESAPVREPSESTHELAPVREHSESTPELAPVWETSESTHEPTPVQEPSESTPETAPVQEPSESTPEPAPVQECSGACSSL